MINWIETTKENIEKYLFEKGEFSRDKIYDYIFFTEYFDIVKPIDVSYCYSDCEITFGMYYHKVTHFALYESILPKDLKNV
jgi:hypothetical protein